MAAGMRRLEMSAGRLAALLWVLLLISDQVTARTRKYDNFTNETNDGGESYIVHLGKWTPCPPSNNERDFHGNRHQTATSKDLNRRTSPKMRSLYRAFSVLPRNDAEAFSYVHRPKLSVQRRQIECKDASGRSVENMFCDPKLVKRVVSQRMCVRPADCVLGPWTEWRDRPDGSRVRVRSVVALPFAGGADCGLIEEIRPLMVEPGAHWSTGTWGPCQVAGVTTSPMNATQEAQYRETAIGGSGPCGGGAQRREVTCVNKDGGLLHPAHCSASLPPPALQQPCEVPCPRDCAVGEWGEWSPCRPLGGCPMYPVQALTTTGYSMRRRRIMTAASASGAACPALEETRACSTPRCASWHGQPWSACSLIPPLIEKNRPCGAGIRRRELRCLDHDQKEAPRSWCGSTIPYERSESCRIACPGDCVLSAWGAWGACTASCTASGRAAPVRVRRRHVLAYADPDGWQCPPESQLVQTEPCNTHSCTTHSWLALPWGPCTPLDSILNVDTNELQEAFPSESYKDGAACLLPGEKTRDVSCVQDNDKIVKDALCSPLTKPLVRLSCTVPCHQPCKVEPWTSWRPACPANRCQTVIQKRYRVVRGGPRCGAHIEERVCALPLSCHALPPPASWATSDWGDCSIPSGLNGSGYRVRDIWCSVNSQAVDPAWCVGQAMPPATLPCHLRLDENLHSLISCDQMCSDPVRYLDASSKDVDTICKCDNFSITLAPSESDCILPQESSCGTGRKLRPAICHGTKGQVLTMDFCRNYYALNVTRDHPLYGYSYDEEFPGLLRNDCSVPCPVDCAAEPWSEWGPCEQEDDSLGAFRTRTRTILYGAQYGGRECGLTLQRASCTRKVAAWRASDWDMCTPTEAPCGRGVQNRTVRCVLLDNGAEVDVSYCTGHPPSRQESCDARCPADCVVSPWSEWSPCEQNKNGGRRDRTRVKLRQETAGGEPCPHLVEAEPCKASSYSWFVGPWDDCQPLGGSPCGEGTKRRIVRCVRDDGTFVNDYFCPNATVTEARESWCYVPCGADCEMSDWGPWDTSACTCGFEQQQYKQYMVKRRHQLSNAAWPGRPCGAPELRAPCPRDPCLKPVVRLQLGCRLQIDSNFENIGYESGVVGHGAAISMSRCQMETLGTDQLESVADDLDPWRCQEIKHGQILPTAPRQQEVACVVTGGCAELAHHLSPWGAWGPCTNSVRSRTRRLRREFKPRLRCEDNYVTIQWANCTESDNRSVKNTRKLVEEGRWKELADIPEVTAGRIHGAEYSDFVLFLCQLLVVSSSLMLIIYIFCKRCRNKKEKKVDNV